MIADDTAPEITRLQIEIFRRMTPGPRTRSRDAARDAFDREGMFNVIHLDTGFKVDLIVRKSRPFSREEVS